MNFDKALNYIYTGKLVRRKCWLKNYYLQETKDCCIKCFHNSDAGLREIKDSPITQEDLNATDWELYEY